MTNMPAVPAYRTVNVHINQARINAIGTAVPAQNIHHAFIDWAAQRLVDQTDAALFRRMAARSGIKRRYSVLPLSEDGGSPVAPDGFYAATKLPPTSVRMEAYARHAPDLAIAAVNALGMESQIEGVTHLVVASCTGFVAPGLDQIIARRLGLSDHVERLLVGFMGCYAAIAALRSARHIIRSEPESVVLVVTVELSSLHLQDERTIEPLLAMLQFGDGAAAALVSASRGGLCIDRPFAINLPDSESLIRWTIGDEGFAMHLSGAVPGRIGEALRNHDVQKLITGGQPVDQIDSWAVHAGGRSIIDAVSTALELPRAALLPSRAILESYGNMSSATLMFVLAETIRQRPQNGVAIAFGPGLACEGFGYHWIDDA
jgi:predicted naringenin-chalcone synthase